MSLRRASSAVCSIAHATWRIASCEACVPVRAQPGHAGRGAEPPHGAPLPQSGRRLPEFPTAGLERRGGQVGVLSARPRRGPRRRRHLRHTKSEPCLSGSLTNKSPGARFAWWIQIEMNSFGLISAISEVAPCPCGVRKRIRWPFCHEPSKYNPSPKADVHCL